MVRNSLLFCLSLIGITTVNNACQETGVSPAVGQEVFQIFCSHQDQRHALVQSIAQTLYKNNPTITRAQLITALRYKCDRAAIFPLHMTEQIWLNIERLAQEELRPKIKQFTFMRSMPVPREAGSPANELTDFVL